jgi:hypothetical protein
MARPSDSGSAEPPTGAQPGSNDLPIPIAKPVPTSTSLPGPHEPPPSVTDKFASSIKDLYGTLVATRNLEIGLFWQRSNYFLVLNTGIALGFFNLKDAPYRSIFAIMGLIASALWFQVCLGGKYWQTRWEQRLMDFEAHHLPDLAFFAADRARLQSDVERGLRFHPATGLKSFIYRLVLDRHPSVSYSMILLAGTFVVAWCLALGILLFRR